MKKYLCPCCGYLTLVYEPPNSSEICPVCYWENDGSQFDNPNYAGGANRISLNEARKNFLKFGACEECAIPSVRLPLAEEIPEDRKNTLFHDESFERKP